MMNEIDIKALVTSIIAGDSILAIFGILGIIHKRDSSVLLICFTVYMIILSLTIIMFERIYDYCIGKIDEYKERERSVFLTKI